VTTIDPGPNLLLRAARRTAARGDAHADKHGSYGAPGPESGDRPDIRCVDYHLIKSTGNAGTIRSMAPKL
jgi:hypothetical protein